ELAAVKGLVALAATLTLLVVRRILQQLNLGKHFPLVAAALVVFAPAWMIGTGALYVPLAYLLLALTLLSALEGNQAMQSSPAGWPSRPALLSGLAAGLCFGAHQVVGALALLALLGASALAVTAPGPSLRQRVRGPAVQLGAFLLSAGAVLAPVLISGGAVKFVEYGFIAKRLYVEVARISFASQLRRLGELAANLATPGNARAFYWQLEFLIPLLVLLTLGAALVVCRPSRRDPLWIVVLFCAAAYLGGLPRMAIEHLSVTLPILVVGLVFALSRLVPRIAPRRARLVPGALGLGLTPGLAWLYLVPILGLASSTQQIASQPHIRGVLLTPQMIEFLDRSSRALRDESDPAHTFLLAHSAGMWYVLSGVHNPTPFDYPLVTAFGFDGQAAVRLAIVEGEITTGCMEPPTGYYLAARVLEEYVEQAMRPGEDIGACRLYHRPP
ncbi:MAG: hypothetical protein NTY23_12150, partial [Chloroflexi bacterium]|nr:hypothetical protein [Chloroflexota bacterium]